MPGDEDPAATIGPLEERYGRVMRIAVLPKSAALSARYGPSDGRLYLIRPDGYVGFKCRIEDAGMLDRHLGKMMS